MVLWMILKENQFHGLALFSSGLRDWMIICDVQGESGCVQVLYGAMVQGSRGARAGC
jgi:hypothetical protein